MGGALDDAMAVNEEETGARKEEERREGIEDTMAADGDLSAGPPRAKRRRFSY
jgi:hypothetical protein